MKIPPAAKVGLLTIIALALLIVSLMWLKGRTLASGEHFNVTFHDVDGMRAGAIVQIMGLKVGQVENVKPIITEDSSLVEVSFLITNDKIKIPDGSQISVQQSGIIGEKLIEITPPEIRTVEIPVVGEPIHVNDFSPVSLIYKDKKYDVGEIRNFKVISKSIEEFKTTRDSVLHRTSIKDYYQIDYIISRAGLDIPMNAVYSLSSDAKNMIITTPENYIVNMPPKSQKYTTVDPLRIKTFLELQVESAAALKETTRRVNEILEPEQIQVLKDTLKNTEILTAKATDVLEEANNLMIDSKGDLKRLVDSSSKLSENMITISNNINAIIGDPQLRSDVIETVHSVKNSMDELSVIISDPNLKETIYMTKETTKNLSELVSSVKDTVNNQEIKDKLDNTISNLNCSLDKLTLLLERTDNLTASQEANIKKIIADSSEVSENMKKFSKKLNKRFLLFRLLF